MALNKYLKLFNNGSIKHLHHTKRRRTKLSNMKKPYQIFSFHPQHLFEIVKTEDQQSEEMREEEEARHERWMDQQIENNLNQIENEY